MHENLLFKILCLACMILLAQTADVPNLMPNLASKKERQKNEKLPPCASCKTLTDSFAEGMKRTARGKHEGGDAAWEEERLGSYQTSEIRLVEIQEKLCLDIGRGEDQCHNLAENNENHIEDWWFKKQNEHPDFYKWLCIETLEACCHDNYYGPNCKICPDCNSNGKCKGNGTRKGNGKCLCDNGYTGEFCNQCAPQYYESFRDEKILLCTACNQACDEGGCTAAGPNGCRVCKAGWLMDPEKGGCIDIDECVIQKTPCSTNQFCVNTEGSYSCLECDKSCNGCSGDGPDLCDVCADGFEIRDGLCTDVNTNESVVEAADSTDNDINGNQVDHESEPNVAKDEL